MRLTESGSLATLAAVAASAFLPKLATHILAAFPATGRDTELIAQIGKGLSPPGDGRGYLASSDGITDANVHLSAPEK
jgi:hypothetical protein